MVWWPFATKPERAATLEVTDLHSVAPPLYSTSFVVKYLFLLVAALSRRGEICKENNRRVQWKIH
jgi:hypothetical protein